MGVDYDHQANLWHRDQPRHHSDFCGRPEAFEIASRLGRSKMVLDLGCGEGYISRKLARIARHVVGVDSSSEMIHLALQQEARDHAGIEYNHADVRHMPFLRHNTFDLCVGNYITNYLRPDELPGFYREMARVTKHNGHFVLLMPHPLFELSLDYGVAIDFGKKKFDYIRSRGDFFPAKLATVDGKFFEVGVYHSRLEDHFSAISRATLSVTEIKEPVFPQEVADRHPIFAKMAGKVACMILVGKK